MHRLQAPLCENKVRSQSFTSDGLSLQTPSDF